MAQVSHEKYYFLESLDNCEQSHIVSILALLVCTLCYCRSKVGENKIHVSVIIAHVVKNVVQLYIVDAKIAHILHVFESNVK